MKLHYVLGFSLLCAVSHAGTITHTDYTAGNVITAAGQNTNENAIVNEFNGNISAANLATNAITTIKITDANVTGAKIAANTITGSNISTTTSVTINTLVPVAGIVGSTTVTAAAAGNVGEVFRSSASSVSAVGSGGSNYTNIAGINLTPGSWQLVGCGLLAGAGATLTANSQTVVVSANSSSTTTDHVSGDNLLSLANGTAQGDGVCITWDVFSTDTPTHAYYVKGLITYSGGPPTWNGRISARRMY